MDACKLFLLDGSQIEGGACGACGRLWESLSSAERCCKCSYCGELQSWNTSVSHDKCRDLASKEADRERLNKAELIEDYDGPFIIRNQFYYNAADLIGSVELETIPDFGYCLRFQPPTLDVQDILDGASGEMHDDWEPEGVDELAEAVDAWNEANANNGTYYEDDDRKWSKENFCKRWRRETK